MTNRSRERAGGGRRFGADWDGPGDGGLESLANPLWRAHCDRLHAAVIRDWTGGRRFGTTLKTDLFDEAVGDGLAVPLAAATGQLRAIDLSERVVSRARRRHPGLSAEPADVRRLPHAAGSFDFVVSISTLDHFADADDVGRALGELVRVLAPGGCLFVTLDNPENPVVALRNRLPDRWFGRSAWLPYFVGRTLSLRALRRDLEGRGMVVRRSGHILHVPRVVMLHLSRGVDPAGRVGRAMLRFMGGWERLARWPTAGFSGHFVAVLAEKPAAGPCDSRAEFPFGPPRRSP